MAKMRDLQPRIKSLQEKYANDRAAQGRATMELYKKEGVSPMGGCLPMLIQMPVFFALYCVLNESVELRQVPFLWIHDLSSYDPYYILPALIVISMVLQQRISPSSADPAQAKMMMVVPFVFGFMFRHFPAGLALYWVVNNVVQALQQWWVTKRYHAGAYQKRKQK